MAACDLAGQGFAVEVIDAQSRPGGKMARVDVGGAEVDMGPSVLTLRHVFDDLFARHGRSLADYCTLQALPEIARHSWPGAAPEQPLVLDLYANLARSADAIAAAFGPAAAAGFRAYSAYAQRLYDSAKDVFMYGEKPSVWQAARRYGLRFARAAWEMDARRSMHAALQQFFPDTPELRQLFARYGTYAGASPYLAPATLHLIAHVEHLGSWRVEGGLSALAAACAKLATELGVRFVYDRPVARILQRNNRTTGVECVDKTQLAADAVVFTGDVRAWQRGQLWGDAEQDTAKRVPVAQGLSAIVWGMLAKPQGFNLRTHNVFFAPATAADEYKCLFGRKPRMAPEPNIYLCAPDRAALAAGQAAPLQQAGEAVFCLINAPPQRAHLDSAQEQQCTSLLHQRLAAYGLSLNPQPGAQMRTPAHFARAYYGSDGALYGQPAHSWHSFFSRGGSRTPLRGCYAAGGGVHPGPGVPMAALSGIYAARAVCADFPSITTSAPQATRGGTSMPKATTAARS